MGTVLFVNHKPGWRVQLEHERELQALAERRPSRSWSAVAMSTSFSRVTSTPGRRPPASGSGQDASR